MAAAVPPVEAGAKRARKGRADSKRGVDAPAGRGGAHDVCQAARRVTAARPAQRDAGGVRHGGRGDPAVSVARRLTRPADRLAGLADSADEDRGGARKGRADSKRGVDAPAGRGGAHDARQAAQRVTVARPARRDAGEVCHGGRVTRAGRYQVEAGRSARPAQRDAGAGFVSANVARMQRSPGWPARRAADARTARSRGVERPGCGRRAGLADRADSAGEDRGSARKGRADSKRKVDAPAGRDGAHDVCRAAQRVEVRHDAKRATV